MRMYRVLYFKNSTELLDATFVIRNQSFCISIYIAFANQMNACCYLPNQHNKMSSELNMSSFVYLPLGGAVGVLSKRVLTFLICGIRHAICVIPYERAFPCVFSLSCYKYGSTTEIQIAKKKPTDL